MAGTFHAVEWENGVTTVMVDDRVVEVLRKPSRAVSRVRPVSKLDPAVFTGAKVKLGRAMHHINEVDNACLAYLTEGLQVAPDVHDPHTNEIVHRVKVLKPIPIQLSAMIGDAVHNLRASLDYLVCDLIRLRNPSRWNYGGMPISSKAKRISAVKLKGAGPKAERLHARLHACCGWQDLMWELHFLDVFDKHNSIRTVAGAVVGLEASAAGPGGMGVTDANGDQWPPVGGTPMGFKTVYPLVGEAEVYRQPASSRILRGLVADTDVLFSGNGVAEGKPVRETLVEYAKVVDRTIVLFEKYCYGDKVA